jgi:hypothetical protein
LPMSCAGITGARLASASALIMKELRIADISDLRL